MLITLTFGLAFGFYMVLSSLLSNLLDPFGLDPAQISMVGLVMLFFSILGAIIISVIVDKTKMYKLTLSIVLVIITVSQLNIPISFMVNNMIYTAIVFFSMSFVAVSLIPICFSFGVELTFPLQPALVNGSMMLVGQALSTIMILGFNLLMDQNVAEDVDQVER